MNDLTNLMASVMRDAISAMLPDIISDIRKEERKRIAQEEDSMSHPMFTKDEMAKHFQVSTRSIENWHKLLPEDLKPTQIGGVTRYSYKVVKYLESMHI